MAVYFFHIRHPDTLVLDEEGAEFEDGESASVKARASARDLAADRIRHGDSLFGFAVELADSGAPFS